MLHYVRESPEDLNATSPIVSKVTFMLTITQANDQIRVGFFISTKDLQQKATGHRCRLPGVDTILYIIFNTHQETGKNIF